jgi:putative DNA primase/helicase
MLNKLSELSETAVIADGGFKTLISTEEAIQVDPKFVSPYMYLPFCKHVIVTNRLPRITDLSHGTYNRLQILRFNRVIPREKQDRTLSERLRAELPGLLNWALYGALDLVERGGIWVEIPESTALVAEYRREENEINTFLEEKCDRVEDAYVYASSVRDKFCSFARRPYSARAIGAMMKAAGFPSSSWPGEPSRRHMGLRWRDEMTP